MDREEGRSWDLLLSSSFAEWWMRGPVRILLWCRSKESNSQEAVKKSQEIYVYIPTIVPGYTGNFKTIKITSIWCTRDMKIPDKELWKHEVELLQEFINGVCRLFRSFRISSIIFCETVSWKPLHMNILLVHVRETSWSFWLQIHIAQSTCSNRILNVEQRVIPCPILILICYSSSSRAQLEGLGEGCRNKARTGPTVEP